jgi:hypothetical protein
VTNMTPEEAARRQAARQIDLDSWRDGHPDAEPPQSVAAVLEDQARNRSQLDRAFAAAWSLLSGGYAVLACNPAGRPLAGAEPITDTAGLMTAWDKHPGAVAGAACGPEFDLVAVGLTDDGKQWLREVAIDPATRKRPPAAKPEPASIEPYREPADPRPGPQVRDLAAVELTLVEEQPPRPALASATTAPGERGQAWGSDLAAKLARPKPLASSIFCWGWPLPFGVGPRDWTLPVGRRVRGGVELLAAVPAEGAVLTIDGKRWRVRWGAYVARRQPVPEWLAPELGGKLLPAP